MKLSAAIRAGARLLPQSYGPNYFSEANGDALVSIAAIKSGVLPQTADVFGQAICGVAGSVAQALMGCYVDRWMNGPPPGAAGLVEHLWPALRDAAPAVYPCGHDRMDGHNLRGMIHHMNDTDRAPSEKIAGWLESLGL